MKKSALLALIDRAINVEELAVETASRNVSSALEWSGCTAKEQERIREVLTILARESRDHNNLLLSLRSKVAKSGKEDI